MAGTSSLDIRGWSPIGDPDFVYHGLLGQVLALLIIELSDRPIIPLDLSNYAVILRRCVGSLYEWANEKGISGDGGKNQKINLAPIKHALRKTEAAIFRFEKWEPYWEQNVLAANGWEPAGLGVRRLDVNNRMSAFETNLLDLEPGGGIPNRTQFKHVVFGPQLWNEYEEAYFPAIMDVVETEDWPLAQKAIDRVARIIDQAASALVKM
ncbi:hypothetical protein NUW58_g10261 [Xylaria curta]|uniref:Uncharacterized protein n=1 Tax=Xylaria curta TaxID=42375 RepID=A0ACC1MN43_9PEZI|nr:hypothetical protein NUW58_g10261 [Xylaria curta]